MESVPGLDNVASTNNLVFRISRDFFSEFDNAVKNIRALALVRDPTIAHVVQTVKAIADLEAPAKLAFRSSDGSRFSFKKVVDNLNITNYFHQVYKR